MVYCILVLCWDKNIMLYCFIPYYIVFMSYLFIPVQPIRPTVEQSDEEGEDDEEVQEEEDETDIDPSMFDGDAGEQAISYMMALFERTAGLSSKRGKGKHPSSEHPTNTGKKAQKKPQQDADSSLHDPSYMPAPENADKGKKGKQGKSSDNKSKGKSKADTSEASTSNMNIFEQILAATKGRGRGRGRGINQSTCSSTSGAGRGRGRGRGAVNTTISTLDQSEGKKGEHWRPDELSSLIKGANHLKPVLKGRFRHASDGAALRKMAWEELTGEIFLYPSI